MINRSADSDDTLQEETRHHGGVFGHALSQPSAPAIAFFLINFVLPALFYFLVSRTIFSISNLGETIDKGFPFLKTAVIVDIAVRLVCFSALQWMNLKAARCYPAGGTIFLAIFALNFLALPTGICGFIPALFNILPVWTDIIPQSWMLARSGALSPLSLLLTLTGGQFIL
ncbi:hypothetical protein [Martelella limonii]|uniref:hypothetical protein n=1 Tax=Martelella limonii TaxID=1647649 RepID=UPI001581202D|nr:hypothetical protein [Martelella limonii]